MKNTIIEVSSKEQSEKVQLKLFRKKILWVVGGRQTQLSDRRFLIVDDANSFTLSISCLKKLPKDIKFSFYHDYQQIAGCEFLEK